MASSLRNSVVAVAMITVLIEIAMAATNLTVGAPGGSWDLNTNFATWASGQTFTVGDSLVFKYSPSLHSVLEVNKANYDSCTTSSPIQKHTSGDDTIALTSAGTRYFICGTIGHCPPMKVAITTVAASAPTPPGSSSPSAPSTPGSSPSPPPPPGPSGSDSLGLKAKAAVGFGFGMLMFLGF